MEMVVLSLYGLGLVSLGYWLGSCFGMGFHWCTLVGYVPGRVLVFGTTFLPSALVIGSSTHPLVGCIMAVT
jgi:hypothetical protein